jgi:hypothetical protein
LEVESEDNIENVPHHHRRKDSKKEGKTSGLKKYGTVHLYTRQLRQEKQVF